MTLGRRSRAPHAQGTGSALRTGEVLPAYGRAAGAAPDTKSSWPRAWSFAALYGFDALQRVALVKQGVPPEVVAAMADRMGISKERLYRTLGLARASMERKVREARRLSPDESSRVLGLGRLVGLVQHMVDQAGQAPGFDAAAWVARWLQAPLGALDGLRPEELMDTAEGQALVEAILARAQSGAYS